MRKKKFHITILGTGTSQGVPVIGCTCPVCRSNDRRDLRLRVSVLVQSGDRTVVIDAGPDFRRQMLRARVEHLDAILLTHEHNDHIIGLDDVRPFNFRQGKDMPVFATERVQGQLRLRFGYVFEENPYPGSPLLALQTIHPGQTFEAAGMEVIPIEAMHGAMPILGFRIGDFTYLTDVKTISEGEKEKAKGSEVLVLNALHHQEHHSHLNLHQALDLLKELAPKRAYLTHISHQMGFYREVSKILPPGIELAYDGLHFRV